MAGEQVINAEDGEVTITIKTKDSNRKSEKKSESNYTWLKVLGWIFLFPIMLWYTLCKAVYTSNLDKNLKIILFLVLFFPVGLYMMWTQAEWKNWVKVVVTALFVLMLFTNGRGATVGQNSGASNSSSITISRTDEQLQDQEAVLDDISQDLTQSNDQEENFEDSKEEIELQTFIEETKNEMETIQKKGEKIVKQSLGDELRSVSMIAQADGGYLAKIDYTVQENLTANLTLKAQYHMIAEVTKKLLDDGIEVVTIMFTGYGPLVDKYGNTEDGIAFQYKLFDDEFAKVNWSLDASRLGYDILPNIGDTKQKIKN